MLYRFQPRTFAAKEDLEGWELVLTWEMRREALRSHKRHKSHARPEAGLEGDQEVCDGILKLFRHLYQEDAELS